MGTTTPGPAHVARFASMLEENAYVHTRHDPEFAAVLAFFARAFAGHAVITSLVTPAPPPRRTHLVTGAQQEAAAARADEWLQGFLRDVLPEYGGTLPSNRAIFKAAAQDEVLRLPRRVIERAIWRRWPEREPDMEGAPKK